MGSTQMEHRKRLLLKLMRKLPNKAQVACLLSSQPASLPTSLESFHPLSLAFFSPCSLTHRIHVLFVWRGSILILFCC